MDINKDWPKIRRHFNKSFKTNFHVAVASVCSDYEPTVTPIGSLFLNQDQSGFYFEKFPSKLRKFAQINDKVCVLGVNSNKWFWLFSLITGRFNDYPGLKLYGKLGKSRPATEIELSLLQKRMKITKRTKGHNYLWGDMEMIRELHFTRVEGINLGKMTQHL